MRVLSYKNTPESVVEFINCLQVTRTEKKFLNLIRIDKAESFGQAEGVLFFATPDMLAGLTTWVWYDNHDDDAVTTQFGSGCSATVTQAVNENRNQGRRTFLGGFDPSVRPYLRTNELTFTIPFYRFREMLDTMRHSCLYETHAWQKINKRIRSAR